MQKIEFVGQGICPLCHEANEDTCNLFIHYRFTRKVWNHVEPQINNQ